MLKLREGFVLRNVLDEYIVMPVGAQMNSFSNILVLNESSSLLWNALKEGVADETVLVRLLTDEYDVSAQTAAEDAAEFLAQLRRLNLMAE